MTEDAMIVHVPPNLCMDDLIELKYSSLSDSIHLVPLESNFASLDVTQSEESLPQLEATDQTTYKTARKKIINSPLLRTDGRYGCPYCRKTFSQKYIVPRHIKSMHENFYQKCHICFQFVKNVKQHLKFRHSEKQYIRCVICEELLETKKLLRDHLLNSHGAITLPSSQPAEKSCQICGKVLNSKKSLWLGHIYYQHMIPQRYFKCPIKDCPKTISKIEDDYNLKTHLLSYHHFQVERIYHCHLCPQKLLSPDDYIGHLEIDHNSATEVSCVICKKSFKKYQLMALHLYDEHKSILRGNIASRSINSWNCAKFPFEKVNDSEVPSVFGPKKKMILQSTKYTLTRENDMDECIGNPLENDEEQQIVQAEIIGSESFADAASDLEGINTLGTDDFFLEIDQNMLSKVLSLDSVQGNKEENLKSKFHSLPKGTKILKATDSEVLLEIDDAEENTELVSIQSKSVDYLTDIVQNPDKTIEKEEKDVALSLDDPQKTDPVMAVVILQQTLENTIEVEADSKSSLDMKRRTRKKGKFPCPVRDCNKSFVAKHSVNMHVRNVHLATSVTCGKCGKSYSNQDNLKVHIKAVHEAVSSPCNWPGCEKVLSSDRQMKSHLLKHTEQPKKCPFADCDSVLKNANVLRMHIKKIHKRVNPWADKLVTCEVCNLKLKATNLVYHKRTHHPKIKISNQIQSSPSIPVERKTIQKVTTYKRYKDELFLAEKT